MMPPNRRPTVLQSSAEVEPTPADVVAPNDPGSLLSNGSSVPEEFAEVFERIAANQRLPVNWDGEDALPIGEEVASRARSLIVRIAEEARLVGLEWQDPAISPSPEGALELSWEVENRWVLLVVLPGEEPLERVTQEEGSSPQHGTASIEEAVQLALWALGQVRRGVTVIPA